MRSLRPLGQWLTSPRVRAVARIAAFAILAIAGILLAVLFIHRGLLPVVAWLIPALRLPFLDFAVYGPYPTQQFVSFDLHAPKPWRTLWDKSCDGGQIFIGPNGPSVTDSGPVITDTNGELIWMTHEYNTVMNFDMQSYRGKDYLTFWTGNKTGSNGRGEMLMLDSNYKVAYRIQAVGGENRGDIHEFRLTDDNTALIAVYNHTQADLRSWPGFRPSDGWLVDGLFQEIDVETNELLFEWRAINHFDPINNYYFDPFGGYFESHPYDYYHLNSIAKDSKGNYLISSRHFHHIAYIEGKTGNVLWTLGGHSKDFKDLSHGKATEHQWQHNARWVDEEKGILSFMDNGAAGPLHVDAPCSKGTMVQLDTENMTATLLHSYVSPNKVRAASQGNLQVINDDQVLVGWGATAAYTEFTMDGTPLCEVHYSAGLLFWFERWKSYRVHRHFGWVGKPDWPPSARVKGGRVYVSWNGATEVKFWELQGVKKEGGKWESVETTEKQGFEDSFALPSKAEFVHYRIAALDSEKNVLHHSEPAQPEGGLGWAAGVAIGVAVVAVLSICAWYGVRHWARRRREGRNLFTWEYKELFGQDYQYSRL
ncbi:uncharacterized protein LTR77_005733 [Saxophila tyrrhenica]|uniref:ASST-domain-containing protein n=1 Tax=Saxophila tyrrhenica TaxID=1690608 RepID=A0AAV9PA43_9PEZI|nr:hypothetical protein LTR77_005733 [Saxophila tyrrhenica]